MFLDRLPTRASRVLALRCGAAASALICALAGAQTATAPSTPSVEMTPAERAQRDADKVFKWILIHSDKPRKAAVHDDRPTVATVRPKPTVRAAEAAVPSAPATQPALSQTTAAEAAMPIATAAAEPVTMAAARPETESLTVPVSLPGPSPASTPTPVAVAAEALEEVLQPIFRTDPKFPPSVLRTLTKGQIQVRFTVLPDGSVADPSVVSTTDSRLRPASLAAVAQWRFAPLRRAQTGVVDLVFDFE